MYEVLIGGRNLSKNIVENGNNEQLVSRRKV